MRLGLPVSFLVHVGLIALAITSIERTQPFKLPEPEPVEVAIITEDGLTRLRQGDRNSKQLEAAPAKPAPESKAKVEPKRVRQPDPAPPPPPPPPPPEPVKDETPPPPEPRPDPIAEKIASLPPEPTPDELARLEAERKAEAERKRLEEERRVAEEKKKREEAERKRLADEKKRRDELKRKQDEARRLAELKRKQDEAKKRSFDEMMEDALKPALKDNDPNKKPPPPGGAEVAQAPTKAKGPTAGAPEGRDAQLTASQSALLGTMIKQAVSRCWNINTGADGIDKIVVRVEVQLRPDGRLAQPPKVVNSMPGPLFADTANSAVRAILQCEPYDFPKELFRSGWDHSIWTFDPRRMF